VEASVIATRNEDNLRTRVSVSAKKFSLKDNAAGGAEAEASSIEMVSDNRVFFYGVTANT
jgi:hypothetical protein